jgi:Phage terminase, small subunit
VAAPKEWLQATKTSWARFGETDMAGVVAPEAMDSLRHLFDLRDTRERWTRASRGGKAIAKGSMEQDVINPLLKQMPSLGREIRAYEAMFGMTPAARKKLIGTSGAADPGRPTLAELLDRLDEEDAAPAEDPRLHVIEGTG